MILFDKAYIVTGLREGEGALLVDSDKISGVCFKENDGTLQPPSCEGSFRVPYNGIADYLKMKHPDLQVIDLEGKCLMAGGIDAHVHFREPGLTHKADIGTESRAALAGGVTTVIDMPNTNPPTVSAKSLKDKIGLAAEKASCNVMFHLGVTNSNVADIQKLISEPDASTGIGSKDFAGLKVFMGSSTGNMLVDSAEAMEKIFAIKEKPVLVHCEDEQTIKENLSEAVEKYGEDIPWQEHENIRSRRACIKSSIKALEMAIKFGTKLTLCHISTKEEIEMVRAAKLNNPLITAETSCNYLWFSDKDYERLGSKLKCNPSVKGEADRQALRDALRDGIIDTIGSDHAPHLLSEKDRKYRQAPSGLPSVQFSLPVLLTVADQEEIPLSRIASVFSEKAAEIYGLNRGCLKEGWIADLVVFDYDREFTVTNDDVLSKCGWTPYDGARLKGVVESVYLAGKQVVSKGKLI